MHNKYSLVLLKPIDRQWRVGFPSSRVIREIVVPDCNILNWAHDA